MVLAPPEWLLHLSWLPVQNFLQAFLDTQKSCLFVLTNWSTVSTPSLILPLWLYPRIFALGEITSVQTKGAVSQCSKMLFCRGSRGAGLRGVGRDRKTITFKTLFHTLLLGAWSNTVYAQSTHKVLWKQLLQPLLACKLLSFVFAHLCPTRNKQKFMHSALSIHI